MKVRDMDVCDAHFKEESIVLVADSKCFECNNASDFRRLPLFCKEQDLVLELFQIHKLSLRVIPSLR